ncbi:MAG: tripartite tricarboxylate transporter substrate-binding protein [Roseomonas sp.]|nr:tripartite tricarboxylate transporter substrate-binding protein [Roseomonas sp.]
MLTRRQLAAGAATLLAAPRMASAQAPWPNRPLTLFNAFAAGGGSDFVTRIVAQRLAVRLGQPVTVENRGGAGGNIGFAAGARAAADGYTITNTTQNITVNPYMYREMPFDPVRDFQHVTIMTEVGSVLVVNSRVPARTLPELIEYAKTNPRGLTAGNGGIGGQAMLTIELLASMAGIRIEQATYRGEGPVMNDLLAGQVQLTVQGFGGLDIEGHLRSGALRAIAVTSDRRSPLLPDVPTIAETLPGFRIVGWYGLSVPAATPRPIVQRLHDETRAVLAEPEVAQRLTSRGLVLGNHTPEQFTQVVRDDLERYRQIIAGAGIQPQ